MTLETKERRLFKTVKQENTPSWENYPLEKIPKLLNDWFENKVVPVVQYYIKYPWMVKVNLKQFIAKWSYYISRYKDPDPPALPNETSDEYFDRIDPKYGLRFYKAMAAQNVNLDFRSGAAHIDKTFKNEKRRILERQQLMRYIAIGQNNIEKVKKYQLRQQLLNNQS